MDAELRDSLAKLARADIDPFYEHPTNERIWDLRTFITLFRNSKGEIRGRTTHYHEDSFVIDPQSTKEEFEVLTRRWKALRLLNPL